MTTTYNKISTNKRYGKLSGILSIQNRQVQKEIWIKNLFQIAVSPLTTSMTLGMSSFSHWNLTFGPY